MAKAAPEPSPANQAQDTDVDHTLIEAMLRLTPTERLEHHERMRQAILELRAAFQASQTTPNEQPNPNP